MHENFTGKRRKRTHPIGRATTPMAHCLSVTPLDLVQLADHRGRRRARARGPCARVPKAIRRLLPAARSPRPARPPAVRVRADGYFSALRGELHSDFQSAKRHRAGRADAAGCGAVGEDPYAMLSLGARRLLRPRHSLRSTGCFYAYPAGRLQEHFAWRSSIGRGERTNRAIVAMEEACLPARARIDAGNTTDEWQLTSCDRR